MILFKKRQPRSYVITNDHVIDAIFTKKSPDWYAWLQWLFPIINASFLTPTIVVTADSASLSIYSLIALNTGLFLWHLKQNLTRIYYDTTNRPKHILQLVTIVLAGLLGVKLALLSLPALGTQPSPILTAFYIVNFISSLANLAASLSGMFLPWIISQSSKFYAFITNSNRKIKKLPKAILERLYKRENFYLTSNGYHGVLDRETEEPPNAFAATLREIGIGNDNSTDKEILLSARKKAANLCYTYSSRKEEKLAGSFVKSKIIERANQLATEIIAGGKFTSSSDGFGFFTGRVNLHINQLVYDLKALEEITEPINDEYNDAIQRIHSINNYMKIDNLSKVDLLLAKEKDINLFEQLDKHICFKNNPKSLSEQITELQEISKSQLNQRMYTKLIKLHDEEGYSIPEINNLLRKRLPEKFREANSRHDYLIKEAMDLLRKKLQNRANHNITPCPLNEHRTPSDVNNSL